MRLLEYFIVINGNLISHEKSHKCVEFPSSCLKYSIVLLNPSCNGTYNEEQKQDTLLYTAIT